MTIDDLTNEHIRNNTLPIDPEVAARQKPFILSIEPCNRPLFKHAFHLGTHPGIARWFAEEVFRRHHESGTAMYTVALMRADSDNVLRIYDVYDGRDWMSITQQRWHDEQVADAVKVHQVSIAPNPATTLKLGKTMRVVDLDTTPKGWDVAETSNEDE